MQKLGNSMNFFSKGIVVENFFLSCFERLIVTLASVTRAIISVLSGKKNIAYSKIANTVQTKLVIGLLFHFFTHRSADFTASDLQAKRQFVVVIHTKKSIRSQIVVGTAIHATYTIFAISEFSLDVYMIAHRADFRAIMISSRFFYFAEAGIIFVVKSANVVG